MKWRKIRFRGMDCMVTEARPRLVRDYPNGEYHYYGIRHSDDDWGEPITIEPHVVVNYWGTLATPEALKSSLSLLKRKERLLFTGCGGE